MENEDGKFEYKGNKIPLVIKIVWTVLIIWVVSYLIAYALPDIKAWLN